MRLSCTATRPARHQLVSHTRTCSPRDGRQLVVIAAGPRPEPPMRNFQSSNSSNGVPYSSTSSVASSTTVAVPLATPVAAPVTPVSYRVTWWQAMRFNGVPERVNGRLAMMAFLYIARREMETGLTVIQQAQQIPQDWSTWPFIALCLLFVYAAFPPALVGAKEEDFGIFRVAAEKTNGRAAMLGLAVLAALEWHSGFCFF